MNKIKEHQSLYDSIIETGYSKRHSTIFAYEKQPGRKVYGSARALFDMISIFEIEALDHLRTEDKILDIGAGAGRISVYLQKKRYDITAIDKSDTICKVLRKRGIKKVIKADIFKYFPKKKYDVTLFVNIYSLFGKKKENIAKLINLLIKRVLKKDGRIIFILIEPESGKTEVRKTRLIFKNKIGPWYESVFPSSQDFIELADGNNLFVEKFKKDRHARYFLILKRVSAK